MIPTDISRHNIGIAKKDPRWVIPYPEILADRAREKKRHDEDMQYLLNPYEKRNVEIIIDDEVFDTWLSGNQYKNDFEDYQIEMLKNTLIENMQYKCNEGLTIDDYCTSCGNPNATHRRSIMSGGGFSYPHSGRCYHILNV